MTDDVERRFAHRGVLEVQVGLVREEAVEVELTALGVERPVRVLGVDEDDADVLVLLVGVAPDVEIAVWPLGVGARLLEPLVLIRRVIEGVIDDDAHVALVRLRHELFELVDRAELRQNRREVGDVVSTVAQRRVVERRDPQSVDPEPLQIVELADEAREIARTVTVAVVIRPHHDFVKHRAAIPVRIELKPGRWGGGVEGHDSPGSTICSSLEPDCKRLCSNRCLESIE